MDYTGALTDHATLELESLSDDTMGGQTTSWGPVAHLTGRLNKLQSAHELDAYLREGYRDIYAWYTQDRIPHTQGETSLERLLSKAGVAAWRLVLPGGRTLSPIAAIGPQTGRYGAGNGLLRIDCVETPGGVGHMDL